MFFVVRGVCDPGVWQVLHVSCALSWYWPATQLVHAVRDGTPASTSSCVDPERWPASHAVQLAALVPVLIWPGTQSSQRPSLLYSRGRVPLTKRQATHAGVGLVVGDAVGYAVG